MRIVVAMSGGVDSSVAAALLARTGHDVIGCRCSCTITPDRRTGGRITRVRNAAARSTISTMPAASPRALGIPHYIVNFEREFADTVIANFVSEYSAGRTPIPCVHCNGDLKFATLVGRAEGLGADFVATGHYARVDLDPATGRYRLKRGADPGKDQSYFLFTLTQEQLAHAMFPVGDLDKTAVREHARELGLAGCRQAGQPRDLLRRRRGARGFSRGAGAANRGAAPFASRRAHGRHA